MSTLVKKEDDKDKQIELLQQTLEKLTTEKEKSKEPPKKEIKNDKNSKMRYALAKLLFPEFVGGQNHSTTSAPSVEKKEDDKEDDKEMKKLSNEELINNLIHSDSQAEDDNLFQAALHQAVKDGIRRSRRKKSRRKRSPKKSHKKRRQSKK